MCTNEMQRNYFYTNAQENEVLYEEVISSYLNHVIAILIIRLN